MSRTRFEDDPRDHEFPARQPTSNNGLLIGLLVAGGLLAVLVLGGGMAYLVGARGVAREQQAVVAEREAAVRADEIAITRQRVAPAGKAMAGPAGFGPPLVPIIDGGDGQRLIDEFLADAATAADKWVGKRVRIKQRVERVDGDKRGFYLALACRAHVYAAAGEADRFGAVRPGDAVEVEATVARFVPATGEADPLPTVEAEAGRLIVNHGPQR
jgi:hypothetical protein